MQKDASYSTGYSQACKDMSSVNNPYDEKSQPNEHREWFIGYVESILLQAGCLNLHGAISPIATGVLEKS